MRKLLYVILIIATLAGCSDQNRNEALFRAESLADHDPDKALAILDSINPSQLHQHDRYMYDFLSIKASDKAYITHASDSLILSVLDRAPNYTNYSEALYYGGRVYSDLGDYPTAIKYFQSAIDEISKENNIYLQGIILSQTARLLACINLNNEAIPYLTESIRIDSLLSDTLNLLYDYQLLGRIYIAKNQLDSASLILNKSRILANYLTDLEKAETAVYLGRLAIIRNEPDSAIKILRGIPDKVDSHYKNLSLLYTTQAYLKAGYPDTAYYYADQLIHSPYVKDKHSGFELILSNELQRYIPKDSITNYLNQYKRSVDRYLKAYEAEAAIQLNSLYNYNLHEKKRKEADLKNRNVLFLLNLSVIVIFILLVIYLYTKQRNTHNLLLLRKALDDISELQKILESNKEESSNSIESTNTLNEDILKDLLRSKLLELYYSGQKGSIHNRILTSKPFTEIRKLLETQKPLIETSPLWEELQAVVISCHPEFFNNLTLLFGAPLKTDEIHIVLLIKSGFKPSEISLLINRAKGSISSRRSKLCQTLLGKKLGASVFDAIIILM